MNPLLEMIRSVKENGDFQRYIAAIPYFAFLGLHVEVNASELVCVLPADPRLIGNPRLPALHGGVVGALLEAAAIFHLVWISETASIPKIINLSVDYLRSAAPIETRARAIVTKHGRRIANVRVESWQADIARPIAIAKAHFLLT